MRRVLIPVEVPPLLRAPPDARVRTLRGRTMGTTWTVKVVAPEDLPLPDLGRQIEEVFAEVVRQMSPWEAGSCLNRFNEAPPGTWHTLPEEMFTVLECSLRIAEASGGAFDPTVGELVHCWGFGPASREESPRRGQDAPICSWTALHLDRTTRRALQSGGVQIDLCAIAKGFAVDRVSAVVERQGFASHFVEIGGECRGAGMKPDGTPWWVSVESSTRNAVDDSSETLVALCGLSLASSGGYRRYRRAGDTCRTHLIDPRFRAPLGDISATTTVAAPLCMHADAWATAIAVLGPEDGLRVATENGVAALVSSGTGRRRRLDMSPAMAAMLT